MIPLSQGFSLSEFVMVFTLATVILQSFLLLVALVVEATNPRAKFPSSYWWKERWPQIWKEILDSLTNPPTAILTTIMFSAFIRPFTPSADVYRAGDGLPSLGRIAFETVMVFFGADIYIYFEHRLMHTKMFYTTVHKTHHTYHVPTAFAGFANHPAEAFFFTCGSLWIQFFVPIHPVSHAIFGVFGAVWTILSHDDRSYHDRGFHYQHHFNPNKNYGGFTPIWDNLFGTRWVNPQGESYLQEVEAKIAVVEKEKAKKRG